MFSPDISTVPLWLMFLSTFLIGFLVCVGLSSYLSDFFAGGVLFLSAFVIALLILPVSGGVDLPPGEEYDEIIFFSGITLGSLSGAWIKRGLSESVGKKAKKVS